MPVFRVERNKGYTVMSNYHLRDKSLSLKAKGLLSQILSLPEDWDYTLSGLCYINRESKDAIRTAVNELERAGYIERHQTTDESGKFSSNEYLRKMDSLRDRHVSLSILPQKEMDKLSTVDSYPSESHVFTSHGCDLPIENELVADAFAALTEQEQSILILHCVLEMPDGKIGEIMELSRYAVQRRRRKALDELRNKLAALMPKGG